MTDNSQQLVGTHRLSANAVHGRSVTSLRPKQERFAQLYASLGNAARAYRTVFNCDPSIRPSTVGQRAYELAHEPAVAARVRELLALAADRTTISARARMVRLQEIVEADPSELVRVVTEPCKDCWSTEARATARARHGDMPNTNAPQEDCFGCKGHGQQRVRITPTDELSPSARKLLKSVREKNGEIEIRLHDQLAASDQLNRMQGVYVDRSVSVTARVDMPKFLSMTPEQALEFLDSLRPAT